MQVESVQPAPVPPEVIVKQEPDQLPLPLCKELHLTLLEAMVARPDLAKPPAADAAAWVAADEKARCSAGHAWLAARYLIEQFRALRDGALRPCRGSAGQAVCSGNLAFFRHGPVVL